MLTKQGRGATSQNFASPPGRGETGGSGGTRGQPALAHQSALRPPWGGSSEARAASAQREGVIRAAVTRRATPPPRGQRLRGRAARQATRAAPTRAAALEWSLFFSPHRGAPVRPGGRGEGTGWGSRAGTPPPAEFSRRPASPGCLGGRPWRRAGTRGEVHRAEAGAAVGEGSGRGHRWARDSGDSAEPTSPTRGPARAPPCPVRSPGAAAARKHRAAFV